MQFPVGFMKFGSMYRFNTWDFFSGTATVLGFQHYLVNVGVAVLIPLTIIRAIGGEAVRFPNLCLTMIRIFCSHLHLIDGLWCSLGAKYEVCRSPSYWLLRNVQHDLARAIQSVLFVSAINTLLQTFFGARLPVVMGNSFYFLPMVLSIVTKRGIIDYPDPHEVCPSFFFQHSDHPFQAQLVVTRICARSSMVLEYYGARALLGLISSVWHDRDSFGECERRKGLS